MVTTNEVLRYYLGAFFVNFHIAFPDLVLTAAYKEKITSGLEKVTLALQVVLFFFPFFFKLYQKAWTIPKMQASFVVTGMQKAPGANGDPALTVDIEKMLKKCSTDITPEVCI